MSSNYNRLKIKKIIQTVNYLLFLNDSAMNYTKLIKLLYIADKEALLQRWDDTITGDKYASMKNGPILSKTYDLIMNKGDDDFEQCEWDIYFSKSNYDLQLKSSISYDELSQAEKDLLKEIDDKFKSNDYRDMINYIHDNTALFPEWKDPGNTSIPIDIEDILKSIGRSDEEIEDFLLEKKEFDKEEEFLVNNCY